MSGRLAASILLMLLAGCATEEQSRYAADLCSFRERKDPVLVAYTDRRDESYLGEPDDAVYKDKTGQIASAVATPRDPIYKYEAREDCYNKAGDFYYPCMKKFEVDLSPVQGIGRALTFSKAEKLARDLCQSKVDEIIIKKVGRPQQSAATACVVQYKEFCTLTGLAAHKTDVKPERLRWD